MLSRFAICACIIVLFMASAAHASQYVLRDLGTLGGNRSAAYGINDAGQVVGYSTDSSVLQMEVTEE